MEKERQYEQESGSTYFTHDGRVRLEERAKAQRNDENCTHTHFIATNTLFIYSYERLHLPEKESDKKARVG